MPPALGGRIVRRLRRRPPRAAAARVGGRGRVRGCRARRPVSRRPFWRARGRRLVLSMHDFDGMPPDLGDASAPCATRRQRSSRLRCEPRRSATRSRCSVCSASCPAASWSRSGWGCRALRHACSPPAPGRAGRTPADGWAPGQVPAAVLRERFPLPRDRPRHGCLRRGRTADRPLTLACDAQRGVRGRGHRRGVSAARGRGRRRLPGFARATDLQGASVTSPFKVSLAGHVALDDEASHAGALNTLIREAPGGAPRTPTWRVLAPLRPKLALRGIRGAVLGGGGRRAPRRSALRRAGAAVTVCARRREQAEHIAVIARCPGRRRGRQPGQLGFARQRHTGRHRASRGRHALAWRAVRRTLRLRPRVQPPGDTSAARGRGGRLRHARRTRHARRPGATAVPALDGPPAGCHRDARRRSARSGGTRFPARQQRFSAPCLLLPPVRPERVLR